jgi:hypothetical protein
VEDDGIGRALIYDGFDQFLPARRHRGITINFHQLLVIRRLIVLSVIVQGVRMGRFDFMFRLLISFVCLPNEVPKPEPVSRVVKISPGTYSS